MNNDKKISIAIANYNNEKFLSKLLDCLIDQTYKNLEIIVVNDKSPGNCDSLMKKYLNKDSRIKYVKHNENKGLFHARLTGADAATGDYIAFLDADDYVSYDFYRKLLKNAEENNSDIVIGNVVLEYDDGRQEYLNLFQKNFEVLNGHECLDEYFKQEGLNFSWHTGCNQLYSMNLWKRARKQFSKIKNRLLMTEDFAFSTVLFYYANKVSKVDDECLYYCKHEITSTSIDDIKYNKEYNNINDLITSFSFVEKFLKSENVFEKYAENFNNWKRLYANMHREYIKNARLLNPNEKEKLNKLMDKYCKDKTAVINGNVLSSIVSPWSTKYENIKRQITNDKIKVISFDIFDTLVVRPFMKPSDLFRLLDVEYRKYIKSGIDFSKIRVDSEILARNNQYNKDSSKQEITLDYIYQTINKVYEIDNKVLKKIKDKEIELEIRFCTSRKAAKELYELAKYYNKTIICTSDMYLPENVIMKILSKNGYDIDKLYLSSSILKTKSTGDLFDYVINDLSIDKSQLLHIGDNKYSDYEIPMKKGIQAIQFYKAIDVFFDHNMANSMGHIFSRSISYWIDNKDSLDHLGVRSMLAIVANNYFDNPFRPFNKNTDFNADPFLIGYYALGMYIYGISKWILEETNGKNDTISFMARDGYLVMKAYESLKVLYDKPATENYLYVSRRALIPVMIQDKLDFYRLSEIIDYSKNSPSSVLKYLTGVFEINSSELKAICKKNRIDLTKNFSDLSEFNYFLKTMYENFYIQKEHNKKLSKLRKYFNKYLGNKPAVFDVGYSGRPEYYLSKLINNSIDTYFLNCNGDNAAKYSNLQNFKVKTFFDFKPATTGNAYELLISKMSPSCIGYSTNDKVEPIFDELFENDYSSKYIIDIMQDASLKFVNDMVQTFGDYIHYLFSSNYYLSMPMLAYLNSASYYDQEVLGCIKFEDKIKNSEVNRMIDNMRLDMINKRQKELKEMCFDYISFNKGPIQIDNLLYNPLVDLRKQNRIKRLVYYIQYDKQTLKNRVKKFIKDRKR